MANPTLNIGFEIKPDQTFNDEIGWLALKKAGSIKVWIKEYKEEKERRIEEFNANNKAEKQRLKNELQTIETAQNRSNTFINENYEGAKAGTVNSDTYKANLRQREIDSKARNIRKREIENKLKELDDFDKSSEGKTLQEKYSKVRWVWQLIGSDRPKLTSESFNESIAAGNPELNLSFDDFLEGGGASYLEPFWEGQTPSGKYPNGIIINAKNNNSEIITADWRDGNDTLVSEIVSAEAGVAFGSVVYLNIYTQNLYGHNIKIQLKDKDKIVRILSLGLTNADDKLHAAEYLDNGVKVEDRNEEDITKKEDQFIRAVSVHTTSKYPGNAKFGRLVDEGEDHNDNQVKKVPNVQKCKFAVFIDPMWEHLAGNELLIYPEIEHPNIPGGRKKLSDCTIKITTSGKEIKVENVQSNMVAVISDVETDIQSFHPCGYNTIEAFWNEKKSTVFSRTDSEIHTDLKLEIIADSEEKKLVLFLPDLKTDDCTYNNITDYHVGKVSEILDDQSKYKNLELRDNTVSFDIAYSVNIGEDRQKIINSSILSLVKPDIYKLEFESCRYKHPLQIEVLPDLEYNFNAHLGVEEEHYLYVKQTKKFHKRDYKAKKGTNTRAAKKTYKKQQKEKYTEDVNNQVTKDNVLDEYQFSVEYEGSYAKNESVSIKGNLATIEEAIERVVYIYHTIDSYVGGSAMKKAENDPATKKQYKDDQKKRKAKRAKSSLPIRFTVDPPKFTGGVKWSFKNSTKKDNEVGVEYEFKLGALPLIHITGTLDLLFAAQFIPYINVVVKALDKAVMAVSKAGDVMEYFGVGNMEADYYFDFVTTANLNIDFTNGAKYHTIDGFSGSQTSLYSQISLGLQAGGYIKAEVFDIKGEAVIHAETTAKFKFSWTPEKPSFIKFNFEGIEAKIMAKVKLETRGGSDTENNGDAEVSIENKSEKSVKLDNVTIFKPFEIEFELFK